MKRATHDDFDHIANIFREMYAHTIWADMGPHDEQVATDYIRFIIDNCETYILPGALLSVTVARTYHARPTASVSQFVVTKQARSRATIDAMFQKVDEIARAYDCLAVFLIPDTMPEKRFLSAFHNMATKRGFSVFSSMYWRALHG